MAGVTSFGRGGKLSQVLAIIFCGALFTGGAAAADSKHRLVHQQSGQTQTATGKVPYTVSIEAITTVDSEQNDAATIVATSYLGKKASDGADRPVIFLFNGGPIVPSVYVHMGLFAPYQVSFPESTKLSSEHSLPWELQPSERSLLDIADLVYIDPPETGYSRVAADRKPSAFYSVKQDAQQISDFVARWLETHQRQRAPVFLFGESYGTMRAAAMTNEILEHHPAVQLNGVMLFGQAVNMVEYSQRANNIISYVASLPSLSLIAAYHQQSAYAQLSPEQLFAKVWNFAQTDYLQALALGQQLPDDQLAFVARQLEAFTGISAEYYIENRLRISKVEFRTKLLPGRILGYYDARYVAPYDAEQPIDPSGTLADGLKHAHSDYLADVLGYSSTADYVMRAPGINSLADWEWGGSSPFSHFNYAAYLDRAFAELPNFHLFVGSGHYDLTTTSGAAKYLVQQSSWPEAQVMVRNYVGGHMAYTVPQSAVQLTQDVRTFIRRAIDKENQ